MVYQHLAYVNLLSDWLDTNGFVFWEKHQQLISRVVLLLNQESKLIPATLRRKKKIGLQIHEHERWWWSKPIGSILNQEIAM